MRKILLFILSITSLMLMADDIKVLRIYQNGNPTHTIELSSIDHMEIIDVPEKPFIEKRLTAVSGEDGDCDLRYDEQGRIIQSYSGIFYEYGEDYIKEIDHNLTYIYTLENGLIVERREIYPDGSESVDTFEYDNGHLVKWN